MDVKGIGRARPGIKDKISGNQDEIRGGNGDREPKIKRLLERDRGE